MKSRFIISIVVLIMAAPALAATVTIDGFTFDLGQFTGAAVTYRDDGSVAFDGKLWDNEVGVDGFTVGELAAGQFGSDPGDQLTLQNVPDPDWFQLTYGIGAPTVGGAAADTFVVYEITSSNSGVDVEGTSWRISFNGGPFFDASLGTATFLSYTPAAENVNQIAFDLTSFGLNAGDTLNTVRVENLDTGGSTSDPDFIFVALEGTPQVPVVSATGLVVFAALLFVLIASTIAVRRRSASRAV